MHRLFPLLLPLVACSPATPPALPAAPPEPQEPEPLVSVTVDAEPIAMNGVVLDARGANLARLVLAGEHLTCDYGPPGDEPRLALTLVRGLGDTGWRVPRIELAVGGDSGDAVFALSDAPKVQLPKAIGDTMAIRTHFNVPVTLGGNPVRVELDGALPATGCGSFEPGSHEADPLPDLIVAVDQEALPIVGATYRRDRATRHHNLTLSTSPLSCDDDAKEAEVVIELTLDRIGRSVEAAVVRGLRVGSPEAATLSNKDVSTKLRGLGRSVHVEIAGQASIAGYPFTFEGQAPFSICR